MKRCLFNGNDTDISLIKANLFQFGKLIDPKLAIPYTAEIDHVDAINDFGEYYADFIEREMEDDGSDDAVEGLYLELKNIQYPTFSIMLISQKSLLERILLEILPSEFMGYAFRGSNDIHQHKYVLQNIKSIKIIDNKIICNGDAFINNLFKSL